MNDPEPAPTTNPAEIEALISRARQARVVELRYFSGLSVEETAEVLKVSAVTVMREWRTAKAWLRRELGGGGRTEDDA